MNNKLILIPLLIIVCACSFENEGDTPPKFIQEFLQEVGNENTEEAIDQIFSSNEWIDNDSEQILNLKKNLTNTISQLGKYKGNSLIKTKTLDDILVKYVYLIKYERQPLRLTFILYKPTDSWRIQNLSFDYEIAEELK